MTKNPEPANEHEENLAFKFVKSIGDFGINGSHVLASAKQIANEFRISKSYASIEECVDGLINWQSSYAFASGFASGLGGLMTLPIAIPSGLLAAWVIQARLAGAVAELYGHDSSDERVRTFATLCLLGDGAVQALKAVGVNAARKGAVAALERLPGAILIQINKVVGFRLLTKTGEKGVVNIIKIIPVVGGVVGGVIDLASTQAVGKIARELFRPAHVPTEAELDIYAKESAYLGELGGYDNAGANSTDRTDHIAWAKAQSPDCVMQNLIEKYNQQFDRQAQAGSDAVNHFYGQVSARLASWR